MRTLRTLKRRRKENKTDYAKRLKLLSGGDSRIVFRMTNRYAVAQYIFSDEAKDKVVVGLTSKNLMEYGWPKEFEASLKSIPATYLTGLLLGKKVVGKQKDKIIIDIGMQRKLHKSRFFGFLKGLKDSGLNIECEEDKFPEEDRIQGKHLKEDFSNMFEEVKEKIGKEAVAKENKK